ncbi:MAG: hypothetical protein Q9M50_13380 [Methylococcales bacterium]|nr:hypothetical protein [Methylococcales bacterium]
MSDNDAFENNAIEGEDEIGSLNHSMIHANLGGLLKFKCDQQRAVMNELSLDISQYDLSEYDLGANGEFKPDVCAYRHCPVIPKGKGDLIKVSQPHSYKNYDLNSDEIIDGGDGDTVIDGSCILTDKGMMYCSKVNR